MPELPDVVIYCEALRERLDGQPLQGVRLKSPFLLRSVAPPLSDCTGKKVIDIRRLGKRIVLALEEELFLVIHLMIAGRFQWKKPGAGIPGRYGLAAFDFPSGTLLLTEAGSKRRASLYVVLGRDGLEEHDRGGLEILESTARQFAERLTSANHTLKRALTDPRLFSGIGNAYSDEILHAAGLSPFRRTTQLSPQEIEGLFDACCRVLNDWTERLRQQYQGAFPTKVTAFREGMATHGRYKRPFPTCGSPIQRIVYAENEANYCAVCQTGGKVLADRALSRLLKEDWPRTLEELEKRRPGHGKL